MWSIDQVEVRGGGFIGGVSATIPAGLTCIIGPRGSGKTTFAEAIRYVLGDSRTEAKGRQALLRDNLGQATIVLSATSDLGERYLASRTYPLPPSLTNADGRALESVELERGTFLPIDAYSSREIEDIADEALGAKRRLLLDQLRPDEMREIELAVNDARRALESNADQVRTARLNIGNLNEQIEELGGARDRLNSLPTLEVGKETEQLTTSARQQNLTGRELEELRRVWGDVQAVRESLGNATAKLSTVAVSFDPESANAKSMEHVANSVIASVEDTNAAIQKASSRLEALQGSITEAGKDLRQRQAEQQAEHQRLLEAHAALGQAVQIRAKAEQDVAKLDLLEKQRAGAQKTLAAILEARKARKAEYLHHRDRISELRESIAGELNKKCGPNVRVRVLRYADSQLYQQVLLTAISGSRLKNQDGIVQDIMSLRPEQLSQIILDRDCQEFDQATGLGADRSRKLLDALIENANPLELDVLATDDRILIELNVGPEEATNFKDASELSRGQKCTALLPLLLARRDNPLLIDQPEDNLDNHFIFETVVEAIRRLKVHRQLIFITHNANIPVLGDAELVIVLNSDGTHGYIEKLGSLDECRGEIIDLLEGGLDAFEQRRIRYGR